MTVCFYHVMYVFQSESRMARLAKWLSVHLRTKWLWVRASLQSLSTQCVTILFIWLLVVLISHCSTHLSTCSTQLSTPSTHLFTHSTRLSTCNTRLPICLSTRSTCLSTHSICQSTHSTRLAIRLSTRSTHIAISQSFYN